MIKRKPKEAVECCLSDAAIGTAGGALWSKPAACTWVIRRNSDRQPHMGPVRRLAPRQTSSGFAYRFRPCMPLIPGNQAAPIRQHCLSTTIIPH